MYTQLFSGPCEIAYDMCYRAHDNAKFASSGGDRSVFIWDVATAQTTRRISGHTGRINVVEFNYDASVVASGSFLPASYMTFSNSH
jgi:WD40 repeat protein